MVIANILSECNWNDTLFNNCMENALKKMRPHFKTGNYIIVMFLYL